MEKGLSRKKLLTRVIVSFAVIGILCVPMAYASTYLGSVWDVYNRLDTVPVAFVNLDQSVIKDGKEYAVGNEIENNLRDNQKVGWKFVNEQAAMQGINNGNYYAVVEIPADFSTKIAAAQDGIFQSPEIVYKENQGSNFVFSQVSAKIVTGMQETVSSSIQSEVTKALVDSLNNVKDSLGAATQGVVQLHSGTQGLLTGSGQLKDGMKSVIDGSNQLSSGLQVATNSSKSIYVGTNQLFLSSEQILEGIGAAKDGSRQLLDGLQVAIDGQSRLVKGSSALVAGLTKLKSDLTVSGTQLPQLVQSTEALSTKTEIVAQQAEKLSDSLSGMAAGISQASAQLESELSAISASNMSQQDKKALSTTIAALYETSNQKSSDGSVAPILQASDSMQQLSAGLQNLSAGSQQLSEGVNDIASGISSTQRKSAEGVGQLIAGAQSLEVGSDSLLSGLNTINNKSEELSTGLSSLENGAIAFKNGMEQVNDGSAKLSDGLQTASEKTGQLTDGLTTLNDGTVKLSSGLETVQSGVTTLSDGIGEGYQKLEDKVTFSSDDMAQYVSKPVTITDRSINKVDCYGEGLAPYFVSMSMWLGAMFVSIMVTIARKRKLFLKTLFGKILNCFPGGFCIGSIFVAIQTLILSDVLTTCLNFTPSEPMGFYLLNMFIGVVFFSVMYSISNAFGLLGSVIMFVLLLLQLASSGGTFPIQTAPVFYRIVNKVVPMTYSVSTLRMTISGSSELVMMHNITAMLIFMISFLTGGYLLKQVVNRLKRAKGCNAAMNKADELIEDSTINRYQ